MIGSRNIATLFVFGLVVAILLVNSCKKDDDAPTSNPFDTITRPIVQPVDTLDPNSFVAIHNDILLTRCAVPGCHDGHFEPDFRTVQSAYSTLVYHPVIKNNLDSTFTYRVVPFDAVNSVLYERLTNCCFVNQNDRMPQDNIGEPLPTEDLNRIKAWIQNGAKDMFGTAPSLPNAEPTVLFLFATDPTYTNDYSVPGNRLDSIFYNPMFFPNNSEILLIVSVTDDSTKVADLSINELKVSLQPDDFSAAQTFTGTYLETNGDEFYLFTIQSGNFNPNTIYYTRYFVNDGDHSSPTQFPTDNLSLPYKTLWSFIVAP